MLAELAAVRQRPDACLSRIFRLLLTNSTLDQIPEGAERLARSDPVFIFGIDLDCGHGVKLRLVEGRPIRFRGVEGEEVSLGLF